MNRSASGGAASPGEDPIALYVHIPYCLSKCPYCDFNSYAARVWPEETYAQGLIRELEHRAEEAPWSSLPVATVFFGGGTPSLFSPATIGQLLDVIARRLRLAENPEITLEANPGTVSQAKLGGFRIAGVNRMSFGVQSFQPRLLAALGRRHSVEDSRAALAGARQAGFENLSLDLIYAVPGQQLPDCDADLAAAIEIAPEHISAYNLTYEEGTPLRRDRDAGRVHPLPEELEVAMFQRVRDQLDAAGYAQYEISNYARSGRAARHNQAYWRGVPYLGLGAGACSFVPGLGAPSWGERWENARDPNRYMARVLELGSAVDKRESLDRSHAMGETCWLALRERVGLDPKRFAARYGEPLDCAFPHVSELINDGLIERLAGRLRLSEQGLLLADSVFASFF